MQIAQATFSILDQVEFVISQIKDEDYSKPVDVFNNSTIGQHFRHTLEFFHCLMQGYDIGVINYDKRSHDKMIETNKELAIALIEKAKGFITSCDMQKLIKLEVNYGLENKEDVIIDSNMHREVIYNIEHAIHHMAIIKIGLQVICPYVALPHGFGVAVSTLRYHNDIEV